MIDKTSPYIVHPKYYMFKSNKFNTAFFNNMAKVKDEYLSNCRNIAKQIYLKPRTEVNDQRIEVGDQFSFHYRLAAKYISRNDKLLDIACGDGYGLLHLSNYVRHADGADISSEVILKAKEKCGNINNIQLHVEDVTNMTFKDNTFDIITSFETIEHVNSELYLKEIRRVLKPMGKLILSTPQNNLGHIPINPQHNYEYSVEEIQDITSKYFRIQKIIGIKQGCIIHENDCKGSNTFMILIKDI
jgi:2-polyprenyl-3-methyl-5-hydroxy-6-metoxy-1,4-benzoquinol methylase